MLYSESLVYCIFKVEVLEYLMWKHSAIELLYRIESNGEIEGVTTPSHHKLIN